MRKPAYALATILILLSVILFSVGALVTVSTLESKIARSQKEGLAAYYVAEAGIQDGLWRLNTTSSYQTALAAGTLSVNYATSNVPASGTSYTVSMTSTSANNATIDVTGSSNNGTFTASRRIVINVFQGSTTSSIGNHAFYSGGALSITGSASVFQFSGGGMYVGSDLSINSGTLNATGNTIDVVGNYSKNSQATVNGTVYAANQPPAPTAITPPSFDFATYTTSPNYTVRYTPAQFQTLVQNGGSTITLPGPITLIDGNESLGNWARNKTINATGMVVINGTFGLNGSVSGFTMNITDPGNGKSGLFVRSNATLSNGSWNVSGVIYAAGNLSLSVGGSNTIAVNGALVAGGTTTVNTGVTANLTYNNSRVTASLGAGTPSSLQVQHWEEEY